MDVQYREDARRPDGPGMPDLFGAYQKGKQTRALTKSMEARAKSDVIKIDSDKMKVKSDALDLKAKPKKLAQDELIRDATVEEYGLRQVQQWTNYGRSEIVKAQTFNDMVRIVNSARENLGMPDAVAESILANFDQTELEKNPALRDDPAYFKPVKEEYLYAMENYAQDLELRAQDHAHSYKMDEIGATNASREKIARMNADQRMDATNARYGLDAYGNEIPGSGGTRSSGSRSSGTRSRSGSNADDGGRADFIDRATTQEAYAMATQVIDPLSGKSTGQLKPGMEGMSYAKFYKQQQDAWDDINGLNRKPVASDILKMWEGREIPPEEVTGTIKELRDNGFGDTATIVEMEMEKRQQQAEDAGRNKYGKYEKDSPRDRIWDAEVARRQKGADERASKNKPELRPATPFEVMFFGTSEEQAAAKANVESQAREDKGAAPGTASERAMAKRYKERNAAVMQYLKDIGISEKKDLILNSISSLFGGESDKKSKRMMKFLVDSLNDDNAQYGKFEGLPEGVTHADIQKLIGFLSNKKNRKFAH